MPARPRRSVLYMPGANARALAKARTLDCDAIIFDLEDAVAPDQKSMARTQVVTAINAGGYGPRELVARVNSLDGAWGQDDLNAVAATDISAVLIPKVESAEHILQAVDALAAAGAGDKRLWLMIETPRAVLNVHRFADHPAVDTLVLGTSDLVAQLRARHTPDRSNLSVALQQCVLAARALALDVLDGVHLDYLNLDAFRAACEQARDIGFDGKTLIHPTQIDVANEVFGVTPAQLEHAAQVLEVWQEALDNGSGVAVLDGQLVENLHVEEAERVLAFASVLKDRQL